MKFISNNEKETQGVAMEFSKTLRGGEVILMYGDLGAGKTVFAKALAKALGVKEIVKSPTFNLMKRYKGEKLSLCHIDAYRLKNFDELLDIGADEYIGKLGVVTVIEWAERVADLKSKKIIKIKIEHGKENNERMIEINS